MVCVKEGEIAKRQVSEFHRTAMSIFPFLQNLIFGSFLDHPSRTEACPNAVVPWDAGTLVCQDFGISVPPPILAQVAATP
jgi:hypothetical protein